MPTRPQRTRSRTTSTHPDRAPMSVAAVYQRLASAIVDHRLPPGTKLPEDHLAEALGVNRARIREALQKLGHDQLVTHQPNRTAIVAEPSARVTQDICEARRVIEAATAAAAARGADADAIKQLRDIVRREESAWKRNDLLAAVRLSREFHLAIAEIAENSVLSETLRNILSRSSLSIAHHGRLGSPGCLCEDHQDILRAIEARSADRSRQLMIEHLNRIENGLNLAPSDDPKVDLRSVLTEKLP